MNQIKNIFNRTELIGILSILIAIWTILYIIPSFLVSLFNTILGNLILLFTVILVGTKNYAYGIVIGIVLIIVYRFSHIKEGFDWSQDSTDEFILLQNTINPNVVFDAKLIKNQASQEELDYFLKNGMWPWSPQVQELYKQSVERNPFVRTSPEEAVNQARTIYNQAIITEIISWQTKEGKFLLNGVSLKDSNPIENGWGNYGYTSKLISDRSNGVIKCAPDASGNYSPEQTIYAGDDGITGVHTKQNTPVDYADLSTLIPGFSFVGPSCNPCVALNSVPDYSCPFNLDVSGNHIGVSSVWQYLWGFNDDPLVK